jgi:hypothetical protein
MASAATLELDALVTDIAVALTRADARKPTWVSRSGRAYQPGLGPHAEDAAVALMLAELRQIEPYATLAIGQFLPYPSTPRQKCDLWLGEPLQWAIEIKMARFKGDNGKLDDTALKDILSPYDADRSALTDTVKLACSDISAHKAILIYGFDFPDRPLEPAIEAFETLARTRVQLGDRNQATLGPLVHPVHSSGSVFVWEVSLL